MIMRSLGCFAFRKSPIAYLLGGIFKWLGPIFGFGLILVNKKAQNGGISGPIGF